MRQNDGKAPLRADDEQRERPQTALT